MNTPNLYRLVELLASTGATFVQKHFTRKPLAVLRLPCLTLLACFVCSSSSFGQTNFSFTLPTACKTSAGVYNSQDVLLRTLWRARPYNNAGTYNDTWDNKDDNGMVVANGSYKIKVLYHNVGYQWDGVIGNTSSSFSGANVWHTSITARGINDMATDGTNLFATKAHDEGKPGMHRTTVANPLNLVSNMLYESNAKGGHWVGFPFVATDGIRVYASSALTGYDKSHTSFVVALNAGDSSRATFTGYGQVVDLCVLNGEVGQPTWPSAYHYDSAIDVYTNGTSGTTWESASGLAVQKNGVVLAVAHDTLNKINLYNKTTGQPLGSITATNVKRIAFAPNGDLWGIYNNGSVSRWTGVGSTNQLVTTLSGLVSPLAVAVRPNNDDMVYVADGGTSQQIKTFNRTGTLLWTFGIAGGYGTDSAVVDPTSASVARFDFNPDGTVQSTPGTYITPFADGSLWIRDNKNYRNLHINPQPGASPVLLRQLMWSSNYWVFCDPNKPERLFSNWLEYKVDYTKPLLPGDPNASGGNGCWKLVRNWQRAVPAGTHINGGFKGVVTLSNGRTYASIPRTVLGNNLVELMSDGSMRTTGTILNGNTTLYANGDLRYSTVVNNVETIYKQALSSFDASGNPVWLAPVVLGSHPGNSTTEPNALGSNNNFFPITTSGVIAVFDAQGGAAAEFPNSPKFHLGGVKPGATTWLWKASPAILTDTTPPDGLGSFPFVASAGHVCGNSVWAFDRNILYGYNGNSNSGSNQYKHFWDNGLFVGQFGISSYANPSDLAVAGHSHNITSISQVTVGGVPYLYTSDEASHSGVHRWRVNNLASIAELSMNVNVGPAVGLVNGATYEIEALCALGKRLSVVGGGTTAGTLVQSITDANTTAQRWTAEEQGAGTGVFELIPTNAPGMRLSFAGGSSANGISAQIDADNNSNYQRWKAVLQSDGAYELIPQHALGQRLDIAAASSGNGAKVELWTDNNTIAQRWNLMPQ